VARTGSWQHLDGGMKPGSTVPGSIWVVARNIDVSSLPSNKSYYCSLLITFLDDDI
jgi:hypothetical protein